MDGVHGDIEAFLGSGFAGGDDFRTEYLRAVRDPDRFPGADDGIDLLTPLQEGLHAVVQERVGCYYAPDESGWKSLPIQSVNLASETAIIETDGTPSTVSLLSELGTGVRAAMTVRSLALPVPRPKYLSVLLVDEWGDVDQATLAQTLYRDLRQLPVPVLAIFTMPDAGQQPVLSDARQ